MIYPITDEVRHRLENNFEYHSPKESQADRYIDIRSRARSFSYELVQSCPPSRELSLALTALEECVMWANAAIARNE